jgi:F0F1-type ATP synthase alpha subunit
MRLDLARPLTKGNVIMFKGERATGKTHVAINSIKNFVKEDPVHNHAIYVGMSRRSC